MSVRSSHSPNRNDQLLARGDAWLRDHRDHVMRIIPDPSRVVAIMPTKYENRADPASWKDIHWAWYFSNRQST